MLVSYQAGCNLRFHRSYCGKYNTGHIGDSPSVHSDRESSDVYAYRTSDKGELRHAN